MGGRNIPFFYALKTLENQRVINYFVEKLKKFVKKFGGLKLSIYICV